MTHQGTEFGVDLYELEKIAKEQFPAISAAYGDVLAQCDRAYGMADDAMRRPDHFGGDRLGPVHKALAEMHGVVVGLLRETKANLDETAQALDTAARKYAEMDHEAGAELKRREQNDPLRPPR